MKLIDFHTHVYPQKIADKATRNVIDFYALKEGVSGLIGTSEVLLDCGKRAGIERFVIHAVALKPEIVRHVNEAAINETHFHKELSAFGAIHAEMEDIIGEVDFILENGMKGVKIHPDTQKFNIDDERLFDTYAYLQEKGVPIMIHCGDPRYDFSHPRRLKRVLDAFPNLKAIGAHLGGWMLFDEAFELLKDTGCFVDCCSSRMFLEKDRFKALVSAYGAQRVLFGSDFPIWDPVEEAEYFNELDLPYSQKEMIGYKNAEEILK